MKKPIFLAFSILLISLTTFAQQIQMPQGSPSAKIAQKVGLTDVTIDYSRPSTKGRKIFGELVPFGDIWRTGANGATVISFSSEVIIADQKVKAGKYALYSVPSKSSWEIILSKNINLWGAIGYDKTDELLRFEVAPDKLSRKQETFEISFENMTDTGSDVSLKWENTRVDFRIETEVDPIVMKQINEELIKKTSTDPALLYSAASYYYTNKKDMNQAYEWIVASTSSDPKYWSMHLKAKLEAALGKKTNALESAQTSKKLADEAGNPDYVNLNNRFIKTLK
jgi:hypothetical protein